MECTSIYKKKFKVLKKQQIYFLWVHIAKAGEQKIYLINCLKT